MAKFFVGQRVRLVKARTDNGRAHLGSETRILALGCKIGQRTLGKYNATSADCLLDIQLESGGMVLADFEQLEPILPSGHRASEFSFTELMDRCREGVSA